MTLTIHLFARARELAGADTVSIELPSPSTVADVKRALTERFPSMASLLLVSAVGAIRAMVISAYGDGVQRPRAFIIADQLPIVLIAVFHLFVVTGLLAVKNAKRTP